MVFQQKKSKKWRVWVISIVALIVVIGVLVGTKFLQFGALSSGAASFQQPPLTVTAVSVTQQTWVEELQTVGSFEAIEGVTVTADLPGKITDIRFTPGTDIEQGEILVIQDIANEQSQLREAEAAAELARLDRERNQRLLSSNAGSQADFDSANAALKEATARADGVKATIARKTIRAPFSGRLGIRQVNLGQVMREGDPVVSLQTMDPIFLNFVLPQRHFHQVHDGIQVSVLTDATQSADQPQPITGQVTTINPEVDSATRNLALQATIANPNGVVLPGMSAAVTVILDKQDTVLAVPQTAVLNAAFGDSLFIIEGDTGNQTVRQQFVRLGRRFGDFVQVIDGVELDQQVVSSGVFKLRNGQAVKIDNTLQPKFELNPSPENG